MRTLKLAERQNNLKNLMDIMKPLKLNFGSLPAITEKEQKHDINQIKSCQASPKVFINSEEAMVWIKKDIDRKNRHELIEMIKKKAEKELVLEKVTYLRTKESRSRRNYSHTLRKYSSTSRCPKNGGKGGKTQNSALDPPAKQQQKKQNHFLSIKVVETHAPPQPRPSIKNRTRTEKSKMQTIAFIDRTTNQKNDGWPIKMKSEGKFARKNQYGPNSFCAELLTPW